MWRLILAVVALAIALLILRMILNRQVLIGAQNSWLKSETRYNTGSNKRTDNAMPTPESQWRSRFTILKGCLLLAAAIAALAMLLTFLFQSMGK